MEEVGAVGQSRWSCTVNPPHSASETIQNFFSLCLSLLTPFFLPHSQKSGRPQTDPPQKNKPQRIVVLLKSMTSLYDQDTGRNQGDRREKIYIYALDFCKFLENKNLGNPQVLRVLFRSTNNLSRTLKFKNKNGFFPVIIYIGRKITLIKSGRQYYNLITLTILVRSISQCGESWAKCRIELS